MPDNTDADSDPAALYYIVGLKYDDNTSTKGVIGATPNENIKMFKAPPDVNKINATLITFCERNEFIIPCSNKTNSGTNTLFLIRTVFNSSGLHHLLCLHV